MPNYLNALGLGFLNEDEYWETRMGLVFHTLKKGKAIVGYYGLPYLNCNYGRVQFVVRTRRKENGDLALSGFDTHCAGRSVWDARIVQDLTEGGDPLSRRLLLKGGDESDIFIADVVNADVLPSFSKDEAVRLQMIAYTNEIRFFENEDAYHKSIEPGPDGFKHGLRRDTVYAIGLLSDRAAESSRNFVQVHGTIRKSFWGRVKLQEDGEETKDFIVCRVATQFGDLEIVMSADSLRKDRIPYMKQGCVADCYARLCGDAGIYELENGIIPDAESNRKLLRYTLEKGDPERLRSVTADRFVCASEESGTRMESADAFISYIRQLHADGHRWRTDYAVVEAYDSEDSPEYPAGTRCLLLENEAENRYLVFADTDEKGKIARVVLRESSGCRYRTEPPPPARANT